MLRALTKLTGRRYEYENSHSVRCRDAHKARSPVEKGGVDDVDDVDVMSHLVAVL